MSNFAENPFSLIAGILKILYIFLKERPKVLFPTGAEIAIPSFYDGSEGEINTAYIERENLTLRQELRRLTRKMLGFSKNRRELQHAIDFIDAHDNFVKPHGALRLIAPAKENRCWTPRTPAMDIGITDHI